MEKKLYIYIYIDKFLFNNKREKKLYIAIVQQRKFEKSYNYHSSNKIAQNRKYYGIMEVSCKR